MLTPVFVDSLSSFEVVIFKQSDIVSAIIPQFSTKAGELAVDPLSFKDCAVFEYFPAKAVRLVFVVDLAVVVSEKFNFEMVDSKTLIKIYFAFVNQGFQNKWAQLLEQIN